MRNILPSSLHIGLAPSGMTLLRRGSWPRRKTAVLHDSHGNTMDGDQRDVVAELERILTTQQCSGSRASVVIADDYARLFMVTPPGNPGRLRDCEAAASMRFQSLYGEALMGWRLAADWDLATPFLACALPQTFLERVQAIAARHRLTLLQIVPCFVAVWNRHAATLPADAWVATLNEATITLGATSGGRLCAVRSLSAPAAQRDALWLSALVGREAMRLGLTLPEHVHVWGTQAGTWVGTGASGMRIHSLCPESAHEPSVMSAGFALATAGTQ